MELAGAGRSDSVGLTIANVRLVKLPEELPVKNYATNGDFSQNSLKVGGDNWVFTFFPAEKSLV